MIKVRSVNIRQSIVDFAKDSGIPVKSCDFTILKISTFVKSRDMATFGLYNEILQHTYSNPNLLLKDGVIFKQQFHIAVHKKAPSPMQLDYSIKLDPFKCRPKLMINPVSTIPFKKYKPTELMKLMYKEINKIKAYNKFLVNHFSSKMLDDIKTLIKKIYTNKFDKPHPIVLLESLEPKIAKESKMIKHYERAEKSSELTEVDEGSLLIEYVKPEYAKNGLDAYGRPILSDNKENRAILDFRVDDVTVDKIEDDKIVKLYSKKRGFVDFKNNYLTVSNQYKIKDLKRLNTNVSNAQDNKVEVVVAQKDITQDTIGAGTKLTSEVIKVDGFVGPNAHLEAKTLTVDGSTHQDAYMHAKSATINCHKGMVRAHSAHVKILEGGEVHASDIHVVTALGGTIYGRDVVVDNLKKNVQIFATKSITIEKISGEDNKLTIDYKKVPIIQKELEFLREDLDELDYKLSEAKKKEPDQVSNIMKKINSIKKEIKEIETGYIHAKIEIKKPLAGHNVITFALPKDRELTYSTKQGKRYDKFYLEKTDDKIELHPVKLSMEFNDENLE
ncbi:MAG: hypothetical protein U9N42_04715 [Campylobacterota bacterium]|nr:hypothetical protein [Campylobacterota bacterium]